MIRSVPQESRQSQKAVSFEPDAPIKEYRNGRDLMAASRNMRLIDLFGHSSEEVRDRWPKLYQWLLERVKPERDQNRMASVRENWWLHRRLRVDLRHALTGLPRYIATVETSKHRVFQFLDSHIAPDNMLIAIALDDAVTLGVLSSNLHEVWALAAGGTLEDRPRYNKSQCFETFPFPDIEVADKLGDPVSFSLVDQEDNAGPTGSYGEYPSQRIHVLAEQLDAHRKRQQEAHPGLTLTGMYNVLNKLRRGDDLTPRERTIHEQGLVSVLRQLHDELDEAVLGAYGWADLVPVLRIAHGNDAPAGGQTREDAKREFEEAILERLVSLNAERAAEEARGHIRWLRPEFQNPEAERAPDQPGLPTTQAQPAAEQAAAVAPFKPTPWPKDPIDQVRAVADVLAASPIPLSTDEIAARFTARGRWKERLPKLLEMLVALGSAQEQDGMFTAQIGVRTQ